MKRIFSLPRLFFPEIWPAIDDDVTYLNENWDRRVLTNPHAWLSGVPTDRISRIKAVNLNRSISQAVGRGTFTFNSHTIGHILKFRQILENLYRIYLLI